MVRIALLSFLIKAPVIMVVVVVIVILVIIVIAASVLNHAVSMTVI